jgi:hypothetical protein
MLSAGFGVPVTWDDPKPDSVAKNGISLQEAFSTFASTVALRLALPRWTRWLPFDRSVYSPPRHCENLTLSSRIQKMEKAYDTINVFLDETIRERSLLYSSGSSGSAGERKDLLSRLIQANEGEEGKGSRLDIEELVGSGAMQLVVANLVALHVEGQRIRDVVRWSW